MKKSYYIYLIKYNTMNNQLICNGDKCINICMPYSKYCKVCGIKCEDCGQYSHIRDTHNEPACADGCCWKTICYKSICPKTNTKYCNEDCDDDIYHRGCQYTFCEICDKEYYVPDMFCSSKNNIHNLICKKCYNNKHKLSKFYNIPMRKWNHISSKENKSSL